MRRKLLALAAALAVVLAVDLTRPPDGQLATRAALAAVHVYQGTLSKAYGWMGVRCRFTPTCSHYSEVCIREFGALRGGWLSLKRVLRCGPWTPLGTADAPPPAA